MCQCSFFPITTVRCVASVCSAKQQVQIASKEGAPPKKDFLATPSKVEPKVTSKKGNKIAGEINSYNVKMKTSHLFTLSDREQTKTGWGGNNKKMQARVTQYLLTMTMLLV